MSVLRLVVRGVSRGVNAVRPYVGELVEVDRDSHEHGSFGVIPGEGRATRFLSGLLGTGSDTGGHKDLVVWAPAAGADVADGAGALAARKSEGARVRALLVGTPAQRRDLERRIGVGQGLEVSDTMQVASLEGAGGRRAAAAIVDALGDRAVGAARHRPGLRPAVGHDVVARASRRAAVVGGLGLAGSDFAVISLIQVGMVASLAAIHDRDLDAQSLAEATAILGAGFGWRALARSGVGLVPLAGPAMRAGIAYGSTRALGELAHARFSGDSALIADIPEPARSEADRILRRLPGLAPGPSEGSEG